MPQVSRISLQQFGLLKSNLDDFKEYCALLIADNHNTLSKRAELLAKLNKNLFKLYQEIYPLESKRTASLHVDLLYVIYQQYYIQQIAQLDTTHESASIFLQSLKKQILDLYKLVPNEYHQDIKDAISNANLAITKFNYEVDNLYYMTCEDRQNFIDLADKGQEKIRARAFDIQISVLHKIAELRTDVAIEELATKLDAVLNVTESPYNKADLAYSIAVASARIYQDAIVRKLFEQVKSILGNYNSKTIPNLTDFISTIESLRSKLNQHLPESTEFLNQFKNNINILITGIKSTIKIGLKSPVLDFTDDSLPKVRSGLQVIIAHIESIEEIVDTNQRELYLEFMLKLFVQRVLAFTPKKIDEEDRLQFPIYIHIEPPKKLWDKYGEYLVNEISKSIAGKQQDFQLPFYISWISALQPCLTGTGLKLILRLLTNLQKEYIQTLKHDELLQYQTGNNMHKLERNFVHFYLDMGAPLKYEQPMINEAIRKYKKKVFDLIDQRLIELHPSPNSFKF